MQQKTHHKVHLGYIAHSRKRAIFGAFTSDPARSIVFDAQPQATMVAHRRSRRAPRVILSHNLCVPSHQTAKLLDVLPLDRVADEQDGPVAKPVQTCCLTVTELVEEPRRGTGLVERLP